MEYVYRGTTVDWAGSEGLRELGFTPVTSDPVVAALFAIEASRKGAAVIYVARMEQVAPHFGTPNILSELECEHGIAVPPLDFIKRFAINPIKIDDVRTALGELGVYLPAAIGNLRMLDEELESRARLSQGQIDAFNMKILGATKP
jgi:hypothetical protein